MSRYIIAERWQVILSPAAVVVAGSFDSPTGVFSADQLDASGECKLSAFTDPIPNSLVEEDIALIKRIRLWSPMLSLGLGGGTTTNLHSLQIRATRRATVQSGQLITIGAPLNLGEWVDVNQTLSAGGLPAGAGWTLGAEFPDPIKLDSSRVPVGLVGSLLNFTIQVEIAHTLPGIVV